VQDLGRAVGSKEATPKPTLADHLAASVANEEAVAGIDSDDPQTATTMP
jgi:hypothetical protein